MTSVFYQLGTTFYQLGTIVIIIIKTCSSSRSRSSSRWGSSSRSSI